MKMELLSGDMALALLGHMPDGFLYLDDADRVRAVNAAWINLHPKAGFSSEHERVVVPQAPVTLCDLVAALAASGDYRDLDHLTGAMQMGVPSHILSHRVCGSVHLRIVGFAGGRLLIWTLPPVREVGDDAPPCAGLAPALMPQILDALPLDIVVRDTDHRILYANDQAARMVGQTANELLGRTPCDVYGAEGGAAIMDGDRHALERGGDATAEFAVTSGRGGARRVLATTRALALGTRRLLVTGAIDVTERYAAERNGARLQARLIDALEAMSDGFTLYDEQDRLVMYNRASMQGMGGRPIMMVPGRTYRDILWEYMVLPGETVSTEKQAFIAARMEEHGRADGTLREIDLGDGRWLLARDFRTPVGGVLSVRTDITAIKQSAAALHAAQQAALMAEAQKAALFHLITEEMRPSVGVIKEAVAQASTGRANADDFARLDAVVGGLLSLMNGVLEFAAIETGVLNIDPVPCDLKSVFGSIIGEARNHACLRETAIAIDYAPELPQTVRLDRACLREALVALMAGFVMVCPTPSLQWEIGPLPGHLGGGRLRLIGRHATFSPAQKEALHACFNRDRLLFAAEAWDPRAHGFNFLQLAAKFVFAIGGAIQLPIGRDFQAEIIVDLPMPRVH